jgi:hypothetical protein
MGSQPCVKLSVHKKQRVNHAFFQRICGLSRPRSLQKTGGERSHRDQGDASLTEKVHAALLEELALEDRINDEVRVILEAYSDEMQKSGANYQEMFRKVKTELAKKYKAIL